MNTIIFATSNQDKINEAKAILNTNIESTSLDIPEIQSLDPDKVAVQKAQDYFDKIKKPLFIEDVSLVFHHLKNLPGTYISDFSKSLGNQGLTDLIPKGVTREATAQTTIVYITSKENYSIFRGIIKGKIADNPRGENGFGWDSIFIPEGSQKTFAEMSNEEKNKFSMRRLALEQLAAALK